MTEAGVKCGRADEHGVSSIEIALLLTLLVLLLGAPNGPLVQLARKSALRSFCLFITSYADIEQGATRTVEEALEHYDESTGKCYHTAPQFGPYW